MSSDVTEVKKQFFWEGLHVPYIAPWSAEKSPPYTIVDRVVRGRPSIGYADETHLDRRRGVLWMRQGVARGVGTPALGGVHSLRQRQCMVHLLCQVCGNSTFDDHFTAWGERHLWVARATEGRALQEGEITASPPICLPCALESVDACPRLRAGFTAALVTYVEPWGVLGVPYDPQSLRPLPSSAWEEAGQAPVGSPREPWIRAAQSLVTLRRVTPVDLRGLAATS
ncbi:hypothetical protein [Streptomyces sp. CFMR 7]|uniref:hypothetical protein n=1 Tax=Streptomyces sp. CFMR 7 TaxID=1649184 RepID=UPI0011A245AA|nr:hypothetical protein [Streptomyces sp. CFMR 7]